jgi:antitoxin PrlF
MTTATVTSKGQITIPSSVRSDLNIGAGDRVEFIPVAVGKYEMIAITRDVKTLKGMIITEKVLSVEEMNAAILKTASLL